MSERYWIRILTVAVIIIALILIIIIGLFNSQPRHICHQRRPAPTTSYKAQSVNSNANVVLSDDEKMVTFNIQVNFLSSPITSAVIVHERDILNDVTSDFIGNGSNELSIANGLWFPLTGEESMLLKQGKLQVRIATVNNPEGELLLCLKR